MQDAKKALREEVMARVRALTPEERLERSRQAVARLVASGEFQRAATVLLYDSSDTEVDTHELQRACLALGKRLCLPRAERKTRGIIVHAVRDLEQDLAPSRYNFHEPLATLPIVPAAEVDLVVVPGVAFDERGNRLGRGAGYYDRFLERADLPAALCSLAFECQIVPAVPALAHDQRVPVIYTERRTIGA
jgi:5-formyltetrahydrofolate cyclo-ligase